MEGPLPSAQEPEIRVAELSSDLLLVVGEMLHLDLPAGTWKVATRRNIVNPSVLAALAPLFGAYREYLSTPPSLGGGGGAWMEAPSPASPSETSRSSSRQGMEEFEARAPEAAPRRTESAKDVHFKLTLARQVKQLVARFMSKLKASWAELVRMGVFPNMPADLGNLPVEALILLKEDLLVQQLVVDVLIKTATTSGAGTSDATQKVMAILQDPDADLLAMIQAGDVSFAGASPFVRLYGLPSFASMFSTAASKFFVSEPSRTATALKEFVERQLTFKTPGGTLRLHPGYLRLKQFLTKAYAAKAEIPVKDVYMAVSEKLELCDGLSVALDKVIHEMYVTRQPFRQGAIPGIAVLKDLVARVGVLAVAEAVRSGL